MNIDIRRRSEGYNSNQNSRGGKDYSKSPTRQVNELSMQNDVVPFDNSPEMEEKKKWKEVMDFMEANP